MCATLVSSTLLACFASLVLACSAAVASDSLAIQKRYIDGALAYVITADLNDPRVVVDIAISSRGIRSSESFDSMVRRRMPEAAVTGTYFDTRTLIPVGSIVIRGAPVHESAIGTAVCFADSESRRSASRGLRFVDCGAGERVEWTGVESALRTGPRLLADGRWALNAKREGFSHPGLFGARTRMALGLTAHNKLLLVAVRTPVTFGRLAGIMKALGAVDAVCLDGGSSSATYYRGKMICRPARALTNIIEIRYAAAPLRAHVEVPVAQVQESDHAPGTVGFKTTGAVYALPPECGDYGPNLTVGCLHDNRIPMMAGPHSGHAAVPARPVELGPAKRFHSLFPVNRAKLPGLKRPKHAQYLVHVSADVKVVHHLVA